MFSFCFQLSVFSYSLLHLQKAKGKRSQTELKVCCTSIANMFPIIQTLGLRKSDMCTDDSKNFCCCLILLAYTSVLAILGGPSTKAFVEGSYVTLVCDYKSKLNWRIRFHGNPNELPTSFKNFV